MLEIILIIVLVILVIGALPHWPYMANQNYGYTPSGVLGLVLVILLVWFLLSGHHHIRG